jgi:hypothetical protein
VQTLLEKLKSIYLKGEGLPHDRIVPTVGLNIGRIEDANVKLVFWDLGGQVRFSLQSYSIAIFLKLHRLTFFLVINALVNRLLVNLS